MNDTTTSVDTDIGALIEARWLAALRSGDYLQGKSDSEYFYGLRYAMGSTWNALGVLDDVSELGEWVYNAEKGSTRQWKYVLPAGSEFWDQAWQVVGMREGLYLAVGSLSENGMSFADIADYYEQFKGTN